MSGAALYETVKAQCRVILGEDYGIPVDEYRIVMQDVTSLGSDMQPILAVTFTRKSNGREIVFSNIYPADDGEILQYSPPEMM